jgi:hypothetical protein
MQAQHTQVVNVLANDRHSASGTEFDFVGDWRACSPAIFARLADISVLRNWHSATLVVFNGVWPGLPEGIPYWIEPLIGPVGLFFRAEPRTIKPRGLVTGSIQCWMPPGSPGQTPPNTTKASRRPRVFRQYALPLLGRRGIWTITTIRHALKETASSRRTCTQWHTRA